jgi:3-hydroxyisobutyrate dehydrogenase-like beta-hydroxyacid dehydrogenase
MTTRMKTIIAVLGLGEAGGRLAADLAAAGAEVRGYDPVAAAGLAGVARMADVEAAVSGCDVVLSVNSAAAARAAAIAARPALRADAVFADLNTGSPALKRELASLVGDTAFADVALLGPVPARGLRTPALASGSGARLFADALGPLGMPIEVISIEAGDAAARKLLRSVFMKGLAASAIESLDAAAAAGAAEWLEAEIAGVIGAELLQRLVEGSGSHAVRRVAEMEAASELLVELGIESSIAAASAAVLARLAAGSGEVRR